MRAFEAEFILRLIIWQGEEMTAPREQKKKGQGERGKGAMDGYGALSSLTRRQHQDLVDRARPPAGSRPLADERAVGRGVASSVGAPFGTAMMLSKSPAFMDRRY